MSHIERVCEVCKIDITDKRQSARTCSPRCRKELSRIESVTPNVTVSEKSVTPNITFEFYTQTVPNGLGRTEVEKGPVKTVRYWYEVPISAIPVLKKDWPEKPEYMNGRQYFLWWKNEFKVNDKTGPIILNPFPSREKVEYFNAGEGSRRWGA